MQNVIIKGRDNPITISFSFDKGDFSELGLNTFSDIQVTLGDRTYTVQNHPDLVVISNSNDLKLNLGGEDLQVGSYLPIILGFSNVYTQGYELTGKNKPILEYLRVV